jgi:hypothetical protein
MEIPFFLAEDTAAVFLHIEAALSGLGPARTEPGPKVPVQKFDPVAACQIFPYLPEKPMILIRAYKKSGRKGPPSLFRRGFGCLLQAQPVTKGAARSPLPAFPVRSKPGDEFSKPIFIFHDKTETFFRSETGKTIPAGSVFDKWVNIWIVPKKIRQDSFLPEGGDAPGRTGRTAGMEQKFHICIIPENLL